MGIGGKTIVASAIRYRGLTIMGVRHFDELMSNQFRAVFGLALDAGLEGLEEGYVRSGHMSQDSNFFVPLEEGLRILYSPVKSNARRRDRELRKGLFTDDRFHFDFNSESAVRFAVCAANKFDDLLVVGFRHYCPIMHKLIDALPSHYQAKKEKCSRNNQGFVDSSGQFINRQEAFSMAMSTGQITEESKVSPNKNMLFSEDLY